MDLQRRRGRGNGGRGETAEEKLDRLIAMERRARSTPPGEQPELRRLKVVREQSEGSAASRGDGPEQGRLPGDAAVGGNGARGGGDVAALGDVPRPSHLPLGFGVCWHLWRRDPMVINELYRLIQLKVDVLTKFHVSPIWGQHVGVETFGDS